ncbi:MAG: phospho-sugar mutase [Myxococcales bacterium]|nr:phospho-sugar mutase [Myxococcales bacterium]MDH3485926.1 phospho-sugar mutase [Myxococcales bacterium]
MSVIDRARAWIAQDPDPTTRRELEDLIASDDHAALEARFAGSLEFGTAGLRGVLGAGPTRMNRVTVMRTTSGLCAWLKRQVRNAGTRGICIGRDARMQSDVFAEDAIEVALGAGIPVWTFSNVVPTPVLAFSVLELGAGGGVMITASHNPPEYNGYKVYWENGAQIIPPNDLGVAREIELAPPANELPRMPMAEGRERGLLRNVDHLVSAYVDLVAGAARRPGERREVRVAYTALHGVAESTLRDILSRIRFCEVQSVVEQATPDGRFPTVAFPNPEEPGAMNAVLALGSAIDADLIIANDPDGDRLAVSVMHEGAFESLSGNDVGVLLAEDLLTGRADLHKPLVISTVVSSPMLGPVAASHGARWEQTLTGHKWIQNRALELEREGYQYVFGYEEALGYAPLSSIRDKDGISSALLIIDLASRLKSRGETLIDALESLWREHGVFQGMQLTRRFEGLHAGGQMAELVEDLRRKPPTEIGGHPVTTMIDLGRQVKWTRDGETPYEGLAKSEVLIFELDGGHRAMVRPSGTEPKLKWYLHAYASAGSGLAQARALTAAVLDRMAEEVGKIVSH